jgi:hypothetical protein
MTFTWVARHGALRRAWPIDNQALSKASRHPNWFSLRNGLTVAVASGIEESDAHRIGDGVLVRTNESQFRESDTNSGGQSSFICFHKNK